MAILHRIPPHQIFHYYTHNGWLGACPVYVNDFSGDVTERNGIPSPWFFANLVVIKAFMWCAGLAGHHFPGWPILRGDRIGHGSTR